MFTLIRSRLIHGVIFTHYTVTA